MKYPMCARVSLSHANRSAIEEFLEWCRRRGLVLQAEDRESLVRDLLNDYFEIDPEQLERERRAILENQRQAIEERHHGPH